MTCWGRKGGVKAPVGEGVGGGGRRDGSANGATMKSNPHVVAFWVHDEDCVSTFEIANARYTT